MIEQELMSMMLQGGTNALFAGFLFWQNREQKNAFNAREIKLESREQQQRDRYEKKIDDQQGREDQVNAKLTSDVSVLDRRVAVIV